MTPLPDLVDQATLRGALSDLTLTPAQLGLLPRLAASASASVRSFCRRDFTERTYDELYTVSPPGRRLVLNHYPVASVDRCACGRTPILTAWQADDATNQRATVAVLAGTDPDTGGPVTGVVLARWASGVKSTRTITLDGSADLTGRALAVTINAGNDGWQATAAPGRLGLWPTSDLLPQGATPALGGRRADLSAHTEDLDHQLAPASGILTLGDDAAAGPDSTRFGPGFDGELQDVQSYGGPQGVRVTYTAGYAAIPADLQQHTIEVVKAALERLELNTSVASESDGVLSWSGRDDLTPIPRGVQAALSPYTNQRA